MAMNFKRISRFHRHFNSVQKATILGFLSLFIAIFVGNAVVFTSFLTSFLITIYLLRKLVKYKRHLKSEYLLPVIDSIETFYIAVHEFLFGKIPDYIEAKTLIVSGDIESEIKLYRQYIMRDFVDSWYQYLSTERECKDEIREFLEEVSLSAIERLSYVDIHDFAQKVLYVARKHLKDYQEAKFAWDAQPFYKRKSGSSKEFKKQKTILDMFESQGKFHRALHDEKTGILYMRAIMDVILKVLVTKDMYSCYPAKELLLEMLSNNLLSQVIDMIASEHFLHETIIQITSDEEIIQIDQNPEPQPEESTVESTLSEELTQVAHVCDDILRSSVDTNCLEQPSTEDISTSEQTVTSELADSRQRYSFISHISVDESEPNSSPSLPRRSTAPVLSLNTLTAKSEVFENRAAITPPVVRYAEGRSATPPPESVLDRDQCVQNNLQFLSPSRKHLLLRRNLSDSALSQSSMSIQEEHEEEDNQDGQETQTSCFYFLPSEEDEVSLTSASSGEEQIKVQVVEEGTDHAQLPEEPVPLPSMNIAAQRRHSAPSHADLSPPVMPQRRAFHFSTSVDEETVEVTLNHSAPSGNAENLEEHSATPESDGNISAEPGQEAFKELEGAIHESPLTLVMDVSIPETEKMKESYGNNFYTLYVIEYIAWHKHSDQESWQLKKDNVKRRFREFITLQERLEEHGIYKRSLRGVKGPQRWKFLPVGQMDEKNVEARKAFLENYLKDLISRPDICNSMTMREFFAYEGDRRLAFVKRAPEMPRIDKVITKTFSSVVRRVSTALPTAQDEQSTESQGQRGPIQKKKKKNSIPTTADGWLDKDAIAVDLDIQDQVIASSIELSMCKSTHIATSSSEDVSSVEDLVIIDEEGTEEVVASGCRAIPSRGVPSQRGGDTSQYMDPGEDNYMPQPLLTRPAGDGCDGSSEDQEQADLDRSISLSAAVLDIAVQTGGKRNAWICQESAIHSVKVLIGRALDKWLKKEISDLVSEKRWTYHLQLLREVLWPNGELDTTPRPIPSEEQRAVTKQQAKQCIQKFFPFYIPLVIGHDQFDLSIDEVLACIEHPKLNRHLAFCIFDLLIETLFPEVQARYFQEELLPPARPRSDSSFYGSSA